MGKIKYLLLAYCLLLTIFAKAQNNPATNLDNDNVETTYTVNQYEKFYRDTLQLFKKYKNSSFYSTTFVADNKMGYEAIDYEYILHNDTILCIDKDLLNDFLFVFANNPSAFSNFYNALNNLVYKNPELDADDYVLMHTKFKIRANIEGRQIIHGVTEQIWQITNRGFFGADCYTNIIFNYKTNGSTSDLANLKYVTSQLEYCEL